LIITSKFASRCKTCGRSVQPGDRVSWVKGVQGVSHAACSAEGKEIQEKVEQSQAVTSDLDLPCPEGLDYLGYQRAGIAYAMQRQGTLIADEMGLGKTVQAIGYINANSEVRKVLVVCPASLKLNWRNELRRWLTRDLTVRIFPTQADIIIINYDMVGKLPEDTTWDLIILDEAHYCKNPKTKRTQRVQELRRRAKVCLALTGTPILNKPIEMWPILQMVAPQEWDPAGVVKGKPVDPGCGAGFFRFAKRYCNAHQEYRGRKSFWVFDGASNLSELQEKLRSTCMVRRLKSDVLSELPPKRREVISIGNGAHDEDTWGDIGDEYETAYKRVQSIPFEEISRVRHEQACKKIDAAVEHISDCVESSGKVVVFAHHRDVIAQLAEGLSSYGVVTLTGETSQEDRQRAVESFQNNSEVRVFVGSIQAAGVGLTLTASSHVVFVELDWVPANLTQAEDRCHRIGQKNSILVQHLVLDGSIDAKMARLITEKQNIADMALDNDTNVDLSKREMVQENVLKPLDISEEEIQIVHRQLKYLAHRCDGASREDGAGFNKLDANFGHQLARQARLSPRQAFAAKRMLLKYRRQLSNSGV
jgi:SWI/SNF-related matrix-associated actin-dependent regulator of chromatin subfamily A-like protein 1